MRIVILGVLIFACLIVFAYLFIISYARRKILKKLYQPVSTIVEWSEVNKLRDIYVSTKNGRWSYDRRVYDGENINILYGNWFSHRPVVLYFHGNSLNISHREYMVTLCSIMRLNLVLVDYRGYGRSDGIPSSKAVLRDADTAMRFLLTQRRSEDIIVWGESLGGSPACYVAGRYPNIRNLVLLSTFMSLHSLLKGAESTTKRILFAVAKMATTDINNDTNNVVFLKNATCPVLIMHSKEDSLIPFDNAIGLSKSVNEKYQCLLVEIEGEHDSPHFSVNAVSLLVDCVGADYSCCASARKLINDIGSKHKNNTTSSTSH